MHCGDLNEKEVQKGGGTRLAVDLLGRLLLLCTACVTEELYDHDSLCSCLVLILVLHGWYLIG